LERSLERFSCNVLLIDVSLVVHKFAQKKHQTMSTLAFVVRKRINPS